MRGSAAGEGAVRDARGRAMLAMEELCEEQLILGKTGREGLLEGGLGIDTTPMRAPKLRSQRCAVQVRGGWVARRSLEQLGRLAPPKRGSWVWRLYPCGLRAYLTGSDCWSTCKTRLQRRAGSTDGSFERCSWWRGMLVRVSL